MKKKKLLIIICILVIIAITVSLVCFFVNRKKTNDNDNIDEIIVTDKENEVKDEFNKDSAKELIKTEEKYFEEAGVDTYKGLEFTFEKEDEKYFYFITKDKKGTEYEAIVSKEKRTVEFKPKKKLYHT